MMGYPRNEIKEETSSIRALLYDLSTRFEDLRLKAIIREDEMHDEMRAHLAEATRLSLINADLELRLKAAKNYSKACEAKSHVSLVLMMISFIIALAMAVYSFIQSI